jgi:polygalacturonase
MNPHPLLLQLVTAGRKIAIITVVLSGVLLAFSIANLPSACAASSSGSAARSQVQKKVPRSNSQQKGGRAVSKHTAPVGRAYYVAPDGIDTASGNATQPWKTIQKAADSAQAGDTVYVRPGVYRERVMLKRSGETGRPISFIGLSGSTPATASRNDRARLTLAGTVTAEPPTVDPQGDARRAIIDGSGIGGSGGAVLHTNGQRHLRISGFTLRGALDPWAACIRVNRSQFVEVSHCRTFDSRDSGIHVDFSAYVQVLNNEVVRACQNGGEESISIKRSEWCTVNDNYIHHTGHEGIDVKEGARHVRVNGNHIHHTQAQGLYTDAWDQATYDIHFSNNIVHDCLFGVAANSEMGGLLSNVWFTNNLIFNNRGPALVVADWGGRDQRHPVKDIHFINNTVYKNGPGGSSGGWGGGMYFENPEAENIVCRNNILSQNHLGQIVIVAGKRPLSAVIENNLLDGDSPSLAGHQDLLGANNVSGDPVFVNAAAANFHLQKNSPARGQGAPDIAPATDLDGKPRPKNAPVDIGAYQYSGG